VDRFFGDSVEHYTQVRYLRNFYTWHNSVAQCWFTVS